MNEYTNSGGCRLQCGMKGLCLGLENDDTCYKLCVHVTSIIKYFMFQNFHF